MFNFHLLAIAQHYAWKSSLGFLARKILAVTVCCYPKGGTFTTKLDLKNQCLINHKTVFGTRNPAFWVGAVIGRFSSHQSKCQFR
jgi:hypothetical protein